MFENRRHFRLREFVDVTWKVTDQDVFGDGTVVNISSSGLLLQTDKVFRPTDNCVLSIESGSQQLPFAPKKGKMMWFRRISTPQERFQCGIQFLPEKTDTSFQQWLENKVKELGETGNATILEKFAL